MKRLITSLLLLGPSICLAGGAVGPISLSGDQVQIIGNAGSSEFAYIYVSISGAGCTYSNALYLELNPTNNPAANAMYATLLAAKISGANVTISTTGCSSGGYPEVSSIYLD
jgi:hypothetical protein